MIETRGLRKSFVTPAGTIEVLKGIDVRIGLGEMVAVVGASGVGKSTLLHILGTLDRPTHGSVSYEGKDVFSLSAQELNAFRNRSIGFIFQFHHLLPEFSALENVMIPGLIHGGIGWQEARMRSKALLDALGVGGRMDHRPGELSGGEQQRVAVARALVLKPQVVLADEPTGNLDTATGEDLFALLQGINREHKTTFVIVTHNSALSERCHRIVRMSDGLLLS